ncbi:MAG: transglutaminase domain-containing protein [Clostridium sp.]|uniref:transglutaminase-like domain-containing protein n=1 Tax=Clostridium sp. TaxID=1506 RepID=UPI0039E8A5DB
MKKFYIPIAVLNVILAIILINKAYIVINISYKNIIVLFVITLLVFELINYITTINRNKKVLLFLSAALLLSIVYLAIYKYVYITSLPNNLINLTLKINSLTTTNSPVDFSLISPFYILIIPILTFLYLILCKLNLGIVVILINTCLLVLYDLLNFNDAVKYVLPLYIFLIFINYSLFKLSTKVKKDYSKSLIIYYLIICIIFSTIIYWFTPSKSGEEADLFQYKFNNLVNINQNTPSNFASIGLNTSKTSFLGSKLQINNIKLSLISGDVPSYLKTKVYYDYNYNRWIENRSLPSIKANQVLNAADSISNNGLAKRNIEYNKEKGTKIKTLSIQNLDNSFGDVMMSPNYITKVISPQNSSISMYDNENYLVGQLQSSYTINYYDYSNTETTDDFFNSPYKNDINNIYQSITQNNMKYGIINDSLKFTSSQRVRELAHNITASASDNNEKLKLIKNYLLNNYKYSLQPDAMNINSPDYVDFFLFNEKKGYCKSFATAAVMLCRAVGIPARYVEGFKVRGEVDNRGRYIIRSYDAHAWAEVLTSADKGIWSILETTPTADYENSAANDVETIPQQGNTLNIKTPEQQTQPQSSSANNQVNVPNTARSENTTKEKQNNSDMKISNIDFIKKIQNYKYIIIIICIIILYIIISFIRRKFIIKKIKNSESLIPLYNFTLKRLKTINIIKYSYETDREFALRIKDRLNIQFLVEAVYKEIYGNEKIVLEKTSIITDVEKTVKNNSNIFKYYIFF